ncbi:MAG: tetratricopeptide repeat protein [Paludibacteraceae bacterium]|nr:tetratricopeptide repeat protein [Paludibacteraceae bacterium]
MAKNKNQEELEERIDNGVQESISKTEKFIENNGKKLLIVLAALIVVILGVWAIKKYVIDQREVRAGEEMVVCTQYFERDSFNLALNGDGVNAGFLDVIDEYGSTKAGKIAHHYAGVCYYHLGQYDNAIAQLKKVKTKNVDINTVALGLIGDCYADKGDVKEAISYFEKAVAAGNEFTAPTYLKKAALAYETQGNFAKAEECYQTIKDSYPKSQVAVDIDRYLERAKASK